MAYWASLRSARFAALIAGADTTGSQRETRINDESYAIRPAIKTRGAISTLLDKRQPMMDTQYAPPIIRRVIYCSVWTVSVLGNH
jgi:hypothetical protein